MLYVVLITTYRIVGCINWRVLFMKELILTKIKDPGSAITHFIAMVLAIIGLVPTILKALIGALSITIIEFSVGIIVNKVFSFGVWDYTGSPGNILGIITPSFSLIWFMISLIMISVFKNIHRIISLQKS